MLVDEYPPTYDISDSVATVLDAEPRTTWDARTQRPDRPAKETAERGDP